MSKNNPCRNNMLCCGHNSSTKVTAEGEIYHCVNNRLLATIESSLIVSKIHKDFVFTPVFQADPLIGDFEDIALGVNGISRTESPNNYGSPAYSVGSRIGVTYEKYDLKYTEPVGVEEKTRFVFISVSFDSPLSTWIPLSGYPSEISEFGFGKEIVDDVIIDENFFASLVPCRIKTTVNFLTTANKRNQTIIFEPYDFGATLLISDDGFEARISDSSFQFATISQFNIRRILTQIDHPAVSFPAVHREYAYFYNIEYNQTLPLSILASTSALNVTRVYDTYKQNCMKPGVIDTTHSSDIISNGWNIDFLTSSVSIFCPYNSTSCSGKISLYNLQEKKTCMDLVLFASTGTGGRSFGPVDLSTIDSSTTLESSTREIIPSEYIDRDYTDEVDLRGTTFLPIGTISYPLPVSVPYEEPWVTTTLSVGNISRDKFLSELIPCSAVCDCVRLNSNSEVDSFLDASLNKVVSNTSVLSETTINGESEPTQLEETTLAAYNFSIVLDGVKELPPQTCESVRGTGIKLLYPDSDTGVLIDGIYYDREFFVTFASTRGIYTQASYPFFVSFNNMIYSDGEWSSNSLCNLEGGIDSNFNYTCNLTMSIADGKVRFRWASVHGSETIVHDSITCRELVFGWAFSTYFPYTPGGITEDGYFTVSPRYLRYVV